MFKGCIVFLVILTFIFTSLGIPNARAAGEISLPVPGSMVNLSPVFEPTLIKGLTVHQDNPFLFDFIVDTGNSNLAGDELKKEGDRLVKYFFACLTVPEKDLWVNLSPYEKDRMVPEALGQTALGRDLLAQDYILKQLTASLIYPEKDLGKEFWNRVYAKAQALYGNVQIPVNTFNKVWILADKASVYEQGQSVFVVDGHLKVMLEEDYLALNKNTVGATPRGRPLQRQAQGPAPTETNQIGSQIVREIVLPEIEKEVNTGKNFAPLRQIFNSLILASWYKKNLKEAILNQVYSDKSTVKGVNLSDPSVKEKIYQQYLKAYKKGVFNYIKEDAQANGQVTPRKYFSGGFVVNEHLVSKASPAMVSKMLRKGPTGQDYAMKVLLNVTLGASLLLGQTVAQQPLAASPQQPAIATTPVESAKEGDIVVAPPLETTFRRISFIPNHPHIEMSVKRKIAMAIKSDKTTAADLRNILDDPDNRIVIEAFKKEQKFIESHIHEFDDFSLEGTEFNFKKDVVAHYQSLQNQNTSRWNLTEEELKELYSLLRGPVALLCAAKPTLFKDKNIIFNDILSLGTSALGIKKELEDLRKRGDLKITDEEIAQKYLGVLGGKRNEWIAHDLLQKPSDDITGQKRNTLVIYGDQHMNNFPGISRGLKEEIEAQMQEKPLQVDPNVWSDQNKKDFVRSLKENKVFTSVYGEATPEDLEGWINNSLSYQFLVNIAKSSLESLKDKNFDPSKANILFIKNKAKNNAKLINRFAHLFVVGSVILIDEDAFKALSNDRRITVLLPTIALVGTFNHNNEEMPWAQQIMGLEARLKIALIQSWDAPANDPTLKAYKEKISSFRAILENKQLILDLSNFEMLNFYNFDGDDTHLTIRLFDPQSIQVDAENKITADFTTLYLQKIEGKWSSVNVDRAPGEINDKADKAMILEMESTTSQDDAMNAWLDIRNSSAMFIKSSVLAGAVALGTAPEANAPQMPDVPASAQQIKGYSVESVKTSNGTITLFGHEHVEDTFKTQIENLLFTTNIEGAPEEVEAIKLKLRSAVESFVETNKKILKDYKDEVQDIKAIIQDPNNPIKDIYPEGASDIDLVGDAKAKYTKIKERMAQIYNKDSEEKAKEFHLVLDGVVPFLFVHEEALMTKYDVKPNTKDLPVFSNIGHWLQAEFVKRGIENEEIIRKIFMPLLVEVRNNYIVKAIKERKGNGIVVIGKGHLPGLKTILETPAPATQQTALSIPDDFIDRLNADKIFTSLYGREVTPKDKEKWIANDLRNRFWIESAKKTLNQLRSAVNAFQDKPVSLGDPNSVNVVFLSDNLPGARPYYFVYNTVSGPLVLVSASFEKLSDENKFIKMLGTIALAATFVDSKQEKPLVQMQGLKTMLEVMRVVNYGADENNPTLRKYAEKLAALQEISKHIDAIKKALPDLGELDYYDYELISDNKLTVKFINRREIKNDGALIIYNVKLESKNEKWAVEEVVKIAGKTSDKAMVDDEEELVKLPPGGIDLNTANMGIRVIKDSKGGVQVNFDPAMIKQIQSQGIFSATPIIIQMVPTSPLEFQSLFSSHTK